MANDYSSEFKNMISTMNNIVEVMNELVNASF